MRAPIVLLLIAFLLCLSACGPAATPSATNQEATAQVPPTAEPALSSPTPIPPGGGEYWIASAVRKTDGSFYVFITRPLIDAVPETIFQAENGKALRSLRWSPDGQYLVFTEYNDDSTTVFYLYNRISRQMQTFDLQQMTGGTPGWATDLAWSPDPQSGQLAFNLCESSMWECSPWLANIFQGEAKPISFQSRYWFWEPGGKSLVFVEQNVITRLELSGMTAENLTVPTQSLLLFGEGMLRLAGFFPSSGGFLTTQTNMDGMRSYLLISEDGSQERLLFQAEQGWAGQVCTPPLFSPDGEQIGLNFSLPEYTTALVVARLDQLPLEFSATPDPNNNLILLWSPDSSIYVTRIAASDTGPFSLGFYDAQTGNLLRTYQPPASFDLYMVADSSSIGGLQISSLSYFDSVWIP